MKSQSQQARAAIFAKLNAAPRQVKTDALPEWQAWQSSELSERVERFVGCMNASHTEIHQVNAADLDLSLAQCLKDNALQRVIFAKHCPWADSVSANCPDTTVIRYEKPIETFKTALFEEVDASINVIKGAIADTGTLAIVTGENEPRALSLVPPVHIAILKESDIVSNFSELMTSPFWTEAGWDTQPPTNLVLISGPSKTADIQQTLAYGAHGPKRLILFLVKE